jgi:DNA-directed RNA polymerase subunit M/transcription elongation factor TFIIS
MDGVAVAVIGGGGGGGGADADADPAPQHPAPQHPARRAMVELAMVSAGLSELQAADLEVGVFNWVLAFAEANHVAKTWANPRFCSLYASKARSALCNVDPASYVGNTRLLSRLHESEFRPHHVAGMSPQNVFPERWQQVLDQKQRRDKYMTSAKPAAMTDQFRCSKCKKRECEYQEVQLRSCDEPATLFITCLNCGHRWRLG